MNPDKKNNGKQDLTKGIDQALFNEANEALSNSLANIRSLIPDIQSLIPKETFSQFEKMAQINELISKQIHIPTYFPMQFQGIKKLNREINIVFRIPDADIRQMEDLAKFNEKLADVFKISPDVLKTLEKIQKSNIDYITQATKTLEHISQINTSFLSSLDPLFNIAFNWDGLFDSLSESLRFINEEEFKEFEYKWAGSLTISDLRGLYDLWKKGDKDKVKQYFYEYFSDEETIDKLIQDFDKNEIFAPRMHIISKALKAHLNSDYELSIPIILAQIDGIFIEKHKALEGKITSSPKCSLCGGKTKVNIKLNARNISEYIIKKEQIPYFLEHIIDTFANLRNDILHGKKLDYPDKDLSTKLIVTLMELNYKEWCNT